MAVFLVNNCKFKGCGQLFATLGDLIQHIEETHIDYDPRVQEKQEVQRPSSLAVSYVLRVFTDAAKRESLEKKKLRAQSPASSICSSTPTGSEFDDEEAGSGNDDSDDSWTTQDEFTSQIILSMIKQREEGDSTDNKPFACPVPGCKKRYKNINGIKYHAKNGHRKDGRVKKPYKCNCGKSYKTSQNLRQHAITFHNTADLVTNTIQNKSTLIPTSSLFSTTTATSVTSLTSPVSAATFAAVTSLPAKMTSLPTNLTSLSAVTPASTLLGTNVSPPAGSTPGTILAPLSALPHTQVTISQNGISQQVAAIPVSAISSSQLSQVLNAAGSATGHIAIPLTTATAAAAAAARKAAVIAKAAASAK